MLRKKIIILYKLIDIDYNLLIILSKILNIISKKEQICIGEF
jgi:hypothetical protein